MNFAAKARVGRRGRLALGIVALVAAAATVVPHVSTASATEGNMSTACAGQVGVATGKLKAFSSFHTYVNGHEIPTSLRNINQYVHQGDTVRVDFKLTAQCAGTYVGISSYTATSANDKYLAQYRAQKLFQRQGGVYQADKVYSIQAQVPPCYYQIDVNTGGPFVPGDFTLDNLGRLLLAAQGGSDSVCTAPTTTVAPTTTTSTSTTTSTTSTTVVQNVVKPSATITSVCSTDAQGFNVLYKNDGNVKQVFTTTVAGKTIDTVTVDAGQSTTKKYSYADLKIAKDQSAAVKVTANDKDLATQTVTNNCIEVEATVDFKCVTDAGPGVDIVVRNTGKVTETITVTRDGAAVAGSPFTVAAGESVEKVLPLTEDSKADVVVTGKLSGLKVENNDTLDCVQVSPTTVLQTTTTTVKTEVLDEVITAPQLARTGFDPKGWMFAGTGFLLVGAALIRSSRKMAAVNG